jgi:multisubunit Na+/H+ antiporter MnhF subunit
MNDSQPGSQSDESALHGWISRLRQTRFTQLLIGLVLLLFVSPFVGTFSSELGQTIATLMVVFLLATVLIAAALAVSDDQRHSRLTLALAGTCLILTMLAQLTESSSLRIAQELLTIGFLIHVIRLIVRRLFRQKLVDYDTIAASLCGYILIGVTFAVVFSLVMDIDDSALSMAQSGPSSKLAIHFGDQHTATAIYFSFVTLTTLGYGDITPVSMPARMLTTAEALIGQLYLVTLVARLVGLHISTEMETRHSDAGNQNHP